MDMSGDEEKHFYFLPKLFYVYLFRNITLFLIKSVLLKAHTADAILAKIKEKKKS